MGKRIKRAAELVAAAADRDEADQLLRQIGALEREQVVAKAALEELVEQAKALAAAESKGRERQMDALVARIKLWAEANRATLTFDNKTKTVTLVHGTLSWRRRPPSVRISEVERVVELLRGTENERFLRQKWEVNREAMLAEPEAASEIPGVKIGSEGEEFVVTPAELAEVA